MTQDTIGKELKTARGLAELTQSEVAGAVGISKNYLSDIERGIHVPSDRLLRDLKEAVRWTEAVAALVRGQAALARLEEEV